MKISQLSVFLENRPHSLLEPLQALAAAGIALSGIALADSARGLLQSGGWAVTVTDMVAMQVEDQPGGLVRILEVLAAAGADIEYMYGFFVRRSGRVAMLFRFARPELAIAALEAAGITMLGEDALY